MPKDFKIGMLVGLALTIVAAIGLATRPSLSTRARTLRAHNNASAQQPPLRQDVPVIAKSPAPALGAGRRNNITTPSRGFTTENTNDNQSPIINYEQTEKIRTQRFHIVRDGENLSVISQKYYGSANKWPRIVDANRSVVKDPDRITPGTKLIIPD